MVLLALLLAAAPAPLPLQAEAERALQAPAAGALMEVATGRLLALVRPEELVSQAHPPGSLMKLVAAWAALRADQGTRSFECTGKDVHRGKVRTCWRRDGHGRPTRRNSCTGAAEAYRASST